MLAAVTSITILGCLFGLGLGWAARRFHVESDPVVDRIDAILPQTQCGQCDYAGCRPYAEAIAAGEAEINQCPPGGEAGIQALADLLVLENHLNGSPEEHTIALTWAYHPRPLPMAVSHSALLAFRPLSTRTNRSTRWMCSIPIRCATRSVH